MKKFKHLLIVTVMVFLSACSNVDRSDDKSGAAKSDSAPSMNGEAADSKNEMDVALTEGNEQTENIDPSKSENVQNRMVIYEAQLRIRVKDFEKAQQSLETRAKTYGGYIAESNVFKEDENLNGKMTIRIPDEHFQDFLHDAEGTAVELLERNVNGKDTTEEYIDLESRLRSKKAVEERLLEFMKTAGKTEDLLKISADLAEIQEQIEQITGKMKFLENQTAYSTITITFFEKTVVVPHVDKQELNTWDRTKKQFFTSLNWLLSVMSGLFIFVAGNLPVFTILGLAGLGSYLIFKKICKNRGSTNSNGNHGG